MTLEELKKMDKAIRQIHDPYGKGCPTLLRLMKEYAVKNETSVTNVAMQHLAWRMKN